MSEKTAPTKILYFAWVRERVGRDEELVALPADLNSVNDFLHWMQTRGDEYAAALEYPEIIRVALNQNHVEHDEPLGTPIEIALFPPMTGG